MTRRLTRPMTWCLLSSPTHLPARAPPPGLWGSPLTTSKGRASGASRKISVPPPPPSDGGESLFPNASLSQPIRTGSITTLPVHKLVYTALQRLNTAAQQPPVQTEAQNPDSSMDPAITLAPPDSQGRRYNPALPHKETPGEQRPVPATCKTGRVGVPEPRDVPTAWKNPGHSGQKWAYPRFPEELTEKSVSSYLPAGGGTRSSRVTGTCGVPSGWQPHSVRDCG